MATMQLLSLGQRPLREELHACDAGPQADKRRLPVVGHLVDGLDNQADALPFAQAEVSMCTTLSPDSALTPAQAARNVVT